MKKQLWTKEEEAIIKLVYPHHPTKSVAELLNRHVKQTYQKANALGVNKSEEFLKSEACGRLTKGSRVGFEKAFKKGNVPWNKGLKGLQIGGKETQFKPGFNPHNTKYDGAISIRVDCNKPYQFIRLSKGNWKPLHVYVWENNYGEVVDGHMVVFKDKNTLNCALDNLEMVTRAENMKRNSIYRFPRELREIISVVSKLKKAIQKHEK